MIFKKKQPEIARTEAFLSIPAKNGLVTETHLDSGDIILTYSSIYKPFFSRVQKMLRKNPEQTFQRKIQLDGLGADVWHLVDGKKNVQAIVAGFAKMHRLNIKEAEISVTLFLKSLGEKGLIVINAPNPEKSG